MILDLVENVTVRKEKGTQRNSPFFKFRKHTQIITIPVYAAKCTKIYFEFKLIYWISKINFQAWRITVTEE